MIIYVLKLENEKYYVGRTCNYERRINEHFSGKGSHWTQLYKPIKVIRRIDDIKSVFEEDKVVKETMMKYGIDNVRGGSYVKKVISSEEKNLLEKELRFAQDLCVICGSNDHFVSNCNEIVVYVCEVCGLEFQNEMECEYHVKTCVHTKNMMTQTDEEKARCCIIC